MRLPIQVEAIIFRRRMDAVEYLLLKRLPERNGNWQPVTGGVEEGESREEALRREVWEETGIRELISLVDNLYYFEFADPTPNEEYAYGVEVSPSAEVVLDGKEHGEFKWCTAQEALRLMYWKANKEALMRLDRILTRP